jgi:hypothetical protein
MHSPARPSAPRRHGALAAAALLLAFASTYAASSDAAPSCAPPAWLKTVALKRGDDEMIATADAPQGAAARIAARQTLGRRLAAEKGLNILALPQVAPKVNRTVHTDAELAKAVSQAAAYELMGASILRPLKEERVCDKTYVAYAVGRGAWLALLEKTAELGDHVQLALQGRLAAKEQERERDVEAARARETQQALSGTLAAVTRLRASVAALSESGFVNEALRKNLERRLVEIDGLLAPAAGMSSAAEMTALGAKVAPKIQAAERYAVGASDYAKGDFAGAYGPLVTFGDKGDADAQFAVGVMHAYAQGVKRDDAEAMRWLRRAATNRHGPAKVLIGALELGGRDGSPSAANASKWFQAAQDQGWSCELEIVRCVKR